jgi:hypothetical protein
MNSKNLHYKVPLCVFSFFFLVALLPELICMGTITELLFKGAETLFSSDDENTKILSLFLVFNCFYIN